MVTLCWRLVSAECYAFGGYFWQHIIYLPIRFGSLLYVLYLVVILAACYVFGNSFWQLVCLVIFYRVCIRLSMPYVLLIYYY